MYQEAFNQFRSVFDPENQPHQNLDGSILTSWFHLLEKKLATIKPPFLKPREFNLWSSATYFKEKHLPVSDLATFLDEYVGMFPIKQYPYTTHGIPDGGPQLLTSQRSKNQELELARLGLDTHRAQLETWVAESLETWMTDEFQPVGSVLVSISPRGSLEEGYPGENKRNYVFVNVYQKIESESGSPQHQLTQYLSFDDNNLLQELLSELKTRLGGDRFSPHPTPFSPSKPAHQIISQLVLLPPGANQELIQALIQTHANTWPIQLSDLPMLPMHDYAAQKQLLIAYCQEQFEQLLKKLQSNNAQNQDSVEVVEDFNLLIKSVRSWFLKWAELNATNYQTPNANPFSTPEALLAHIEESWQLELKKKSDQQLTQAETSRLKQLSSQAKLNPLTPLFRLSSVAHCIVGTPGSLVFKSISLNHLTSLRAGGFVNAELLSLEQKLELSSFLSNLTLIKVQNLETNDVEDYYIQLTDSKYAADYATGCYAKNVDGEKVIFGPCDVPLTEDGLIVSGSVLSKTEHHALQTALTQQELTSVKQALLDNLNLSLEQKAVIERVFHLLSTKLFATSLTSFISGVTESKPLQLANLPPDFWITLALTPNPLPILKNLLESLDLSELEMLEEITIYQDAPNSPHSISSGKDSIIGQHGRRTRTTSQLDSNGHPNLSIAQT